MIAKVFNRQVVVKGVRVTNPKDQNGFTMMTMTQTNGTNSVDVFGTGGAPANMTITAVVAISKDTTAANITPKTNGNTVCTIAKGTTAGLAIQGTSLTNTTVKEGQSVTLLSSSSGDAMVLISWTFDAA